MINGRQLYEDKVRQHGASGSQIDYPPVYIRALRDAILQVVTDLDADAIAMPNDADKNIDLDQKYEPALSAAIDVQVAEGGQFRVRDGMKFDDLQAVYATLMRKARGRRDHDADDADKIGYRDAE